MPKIEFERHLSSFKVIQMPWRTSAFSTLEILPVFSAPNPDFPKEIMLPQENWHLPPVFLLPHFPHSRWAELSCKTVVQGKKWSCSWLRAAGPSGNTLNSVIHGAQRGAQRLLAL